MASATEDHAEGGVEPSTPARRRLQAMVKVPTKLLWKGLEIEAGNDSQDDKSRLLSEEMDRVRELQLTMHDYSVIASFGQVRFTEEQLASKECARFACLSVNTDVAAIVKLMLRGWRLKPPSVLISVTGSAQGLSIEPRLENLFIEGLSSAAFCTNAWCVCPAPARATPPAWPPPSPHTAAGGQCCRCPTPPTVCPAS